MHFTLQRQAGREKARRKIIRFRVDGAKELGSDEFVKALEGMGIECDMVPRYEHWKNGKMERVFHTIQGRMLAMLTAAQLPLTYWGEAALTAGVLFNLTISSALLKDITLFEVLMNIKPDVSVKLQTKLGIKSCECLFMGYPLSGRGYRLRSLTTNYFFDSGNIIFDKNIPYHTLHEVSSTPVDYSPLPFPAEVHDTITPSNLPDDNHASDTHDDMAADHDSLLPPSEEPSMPFAKVLPSR
jgi:hypothetical protein